MKNEGFVRSGTWQLEPDAKRVYVDLQGFELFWVVVDVTGL